MSARPFLTAEWRKLAMFNYVVDPQLLEPLVPKGTELDLWEGRAYVSLVAFLFKRTRVLGMALPFHVNFEELNLRFYVRREHPDGLRRGVVFIKELVPRWAIAFVARTVYNENYYSMPMRHVAVTSGDLERVTYEVRGPSKQWSRLGVTVRGEPQAMVEGSEQQFIAEHYWGYARQRDGETVEYKVEHPPWQVRTAEVTDIDLDVPDLYGEAYASALSGEPHSVFLAEGSEVAVHKGVRMK